MWIKTILSKDVKMTIIVKKQIYNYPNFSGPAPVNK